TGAGAENGGRGKCRSGWDSVDLGFGHGDPAWSLAISVCCGAHVFAHSEVRADGVLMMRLILFLTLAAAAFGQNYGQTLTMTMTRNVTATPDQVVFSVAVSAPPDKTLTDVVGLLTGTGITAADLSYVSGGKTVEWNFALSSPFSKMKETVATLAATAQRIDSQ